MKKIRNNTLIRKPFLYFVLLFFATLVLNCSSEEAKDSKSSANSAICGDGTLDSGESCDDGNTIDGDGCQANCALPTCGDGIVDSGEACDAGASNSDTTADACRTTCVLAYCGDGIADATEACDAGASNSDTTADACRTTCVLAACGDGTLDSGESCDDGNTIDGDGCQANCALPTCGDGIVDTGEACDDSNALDDGNGCASNCSASATASASAYTAAPNWNDYVRASDGVTPCDGTETGGYDQCIHGGESRVLTLGGQSSCDGITATDALGAFSWLCRVNAGQAEVYSTSLADGKYLSDLIDWSASPPVWRPNSITVTMTGGSLTTAFSVWYGNTIVENTTGGSLTDIDADGVGEIYAVTANPAMPITIDASKLALVIKPGVTMTGSATMAETLVNVNGSGTAKDFVWIEGAFDGAGEDLFAISSNTNNFLVLRNINAVANNYALYLELASSSKFVDIIARGSVLTIAGTGVRHISGDNNIFRNIDVSNSIAFGMLINGTGHVLENIVANNNQKTGIMLYSTNNRVNNVVANGNAVVATNLFGIDVGGADNILTNIVANNNAGTGLYVSSANNTFTDVVASDNGSRGITVSGSGNKFFDVVASNNTATAIWLNVGSDNTSVHKLLVSQSAVSVDSAGNIFSDVTVNNATGDSLTNTGALNQYSRALAANNQSGLAYIIANDTVVNDIVSATNTSAEIAIGFGGAAIFSGLLKVYAANCSGGGVGTGINTDCTPEGVSDFTLSAGVSLANTFVGLISEDDTTNPNDTAGVALYDDITDWANFDNPFRTWGKAETANPFPSVDYQGACTTGTNCQIWDWRLKAGDTGDNGGAVALAVLTMHNNGNAADTITHSWSGAAASQANCDTLQAGSVFVTDHCESIFLRNATEIMNDGLGNDNGLCESNETCMYTPNIGAYQGHGNIISAGTFTDGDTLTGITLMKYEENGI